MGSSRAALIVFRRRGGEEPGFRLPGGHRDRPLAIAFCLWLLSTRTFKQAWVLAVLMRRWGRAGWPGAAERGTAFDIPKGEGK